MGTALLGEKGVSVPAGGDGDVVWVDKENPPVRDGVWDEVTRGLRAAGHDAVAVGPEGDGFDFRQYIDPKVLRRLDEVALGEECGG